MKRIIYCSECGRAIGAMGSPTHSELTEAAKGSPYAGMLRLVPANVTEIFAEMLTFVCVSHTFVESSDGSEKEGSGEKEREEAGQINALESSSENAGRAESGNGPADESTGRNGESGASVGRTARGGG